MTPQKIVVVNNFLQKNYRYTLTEPVGTHFDPLFTPELTPHEMINLGIFGGKYETVNSSEFPKEWFTKKSLNSHTKDASKNFFQINASQPLIVWQEKGWIYHEDPQGWFLWYCRYFMGRRIPYEDARQINRWQAMRRHVAQIEKNCVRRDQLCRRKQRQALLHWGYDSRKL